MRRLELTPTWAAQLRDARVHQRLGIINTAEVLGVSVRVIRRWCRELGLSDPPSLGRPRVYASPEAKRIARNQREWDRRHAAD